MEKQLDNKIKEAFHKKDISFSYENKDTLWRRISDNIAHKKGVAAFWRVAAVILALIAFGGAFAGISISNNQKQKIAEIQIQNLELKHIVDSLQSIVPEKIIEIQFVEKEKIVYREVVNKSVENDNSETKIETLESEYSRLTGILKSTNSQLQIARDSLNFTISELEDFKNEKNSSLPEKKAQVFKLKKERTKDQMQPVKTEPSPKMKLQLFKIQDNNIKYDINSTLLKK